MKTHFYCLFILLGLCSSAVAQGKLLTSLDESLHRYEVDQLDLTSLYSKLDNSSKFHQLSLQLGDEVYDLELWDSGLRSSTKVTLASGKAYQGSAPLPLKGYVKGSPETSVRITINKDFFLGYVKKGNQVLRIEPAWHYDHSAEKDLVVSYYETDVKELKNPGTCGVHGHNDQLEKEIVEQTKSANKLPGNCYEVEIGLAADWLMVDKLGSESAVDNEICGILNNVAGLYDDEFVDFFEFDLTDVFISDCSTCDPWTSSTSASALLNSFANWAGGGLDGHDVATLWTARDFNGSTIGLAWLPGVCTGNRYNVCEHFTNNSSLLTVVQAHEIGHNFNADHDSGGGFIMSPSANNTTTWSQDSQDDIVAHAANVNCFETCDSGSPPTANFSFNYITECAPGEVEFFDMSNLANEWLWTFEGGSPSTSTEENPIVFYAQSGTYDVTLEVFNDAGDDEFEWEEAIVISGALIADFDYEGHELEVEFEDESAAGSSAEYSWDFGDGGSSDEQHPTYEYGAPGTYLVTLEVEDDCGSGYVEKEVIVYDNPEAIFSADPLTICQGDMVQFTDLSYGNIENWNWIFMGGTPASSTISDPLVTYNSAGVYDVSLEVENPEGDDTHEKDAYITVLAAPTAGFTFAVNDNTVTFTNSSTGATSYLWDFGDGTTSAEAMPTHVYAGSGTYTVLLTSTNPCNSSTSSQTVTISLQPVAAFTTNQAPTGCADFTLGFIDNSAGSPTSWNWTFPGATPASSTLQNPTVVYNTRGTYTVTLTSSNSFGSNTVTMSNFVNIEDVPELSASHVPNLLTVQFSSTANHYDNLLWEFGDGNTSGLLSPTHTYASAGTYNAKVTASNGCGSVSQDFTITVNLLPDANITSNITSGCEGMVVQYSNNTTTSINTYSWSFPGGTPSTSTDPNPVVTYATAGSYDASLTVTNNAGQGSSTLSNYITVTELPSINFNQQLTGNSLQMSNAGSNVSWAISNGVTSDQQSWTHVFTENGTYTVTVTSSTSCGTVSDSFTVTVNAYPTASYSASVSSGCTPLVVSYTSNSSQATNHSWSFPGGTPSTSTEANPVITYNTQGNYDVSLTVSNSYGSDVAANTQSISVSTLAPLSYNSNLSGNNIQLSNTTPGTSTQWIISDGTNSTNPSLNHVFDQNGTYQVTLQVSNGCGTEETTFDVTVDVYPESSFSFGSTSGCLPLTVTFMSGANASDNHNWSFPGGTPSTSSDVNPTVTYNSEGVFDVSLTISNTYGTDATTSPQLISVGNLAALTYESTVNGNAVQLNNTTPGTSTQWILSDGTTSVSPTLDHVFDQNGTYQVTLQVSNGCGSDEITFDVTVDAYPDANFSFTQATGCAPLAVTYTSNSNNADTHNWSFPGGNPNTAMGINATVVYETVGTYDVSLNVSNNFGTDMVSQTGLVTVSDLPTTDYTFQLDQGDFSVNNMTLDANLIMWDFGDGNTSTDVNATHTYTESGDYTVIMTASNICGTVVDTLLLEVMLVSSVDDLEVVEGWTVSPNPSSGEVRLTFEQPLQEEIRYKLIDYTGEEIKKNTINKDSVEEKINVNQQGMFLLVIQYGDQVSVERIVVIK